MASSQSVLNNLVVIPSEARNLGFALVIPSGARDLGLPCHSEQSEGPAFPLSFRAKRGTCFGLIIPTPTLCHPERSGEPAFAFVIPSKARDLGFIRPTPTKKAQTVRSAPQSSTVTIISYCIGSTGHISPNYFPHRINHLIPKPRLEALDKILTESKRRALARRRLRSETERQITMAPVTRSHQKTWCYGTLSKISIRQSSFEVKLLREIISAFSPQRKFFSTDWENGPGGIRTRICDLDRVLCCRYTTGPERSFWQWREDSKVMP
jgi:hypothetical protein